MIPKTSTCPYAIFFSVPLFGLRNFLLIFIFHFENLSKFIIFSNEDVRRIEPQTNNHKSNYRTTRPVRDELPDLPILILDNLHGISRWYYFLHIIERYSWLWIQSAINNERCLSPWGYYAVPIRVCGTEKYIDARTPLLWSWRGGGGALKSRCGCVYTRTLKVDPKQVFGLFISAS